MNLKLWFYFAKFFFSLFFFWARVWNYPYFDRLPEFSQIFREIIFRAKIFLYFLRKTNFWTYFNSSHSLLNPFFILKTNILFLFLPWVLNWILSLDSSIFNSKSRFKTWNSHHNPSLSLIDRIDWQDLKKVKTLILDEQNRKEAKDHQKITLN